MKPVIRCSKCGNAALKLGVGFTNPSELICTQRSGTVEPDDGCTFGFLGEPTTAVHDYEIDLGNAAAVCGY